MEIIADIPFELNLPALARTVRLEAGTADALEFESLANEVREIAKPKALYKECFVEKTGNDTVRIDNIDFTSRVLSRNLGKTARVFAYVATCGREVDQIKIPPDNYLKNFWMDTIKAALLACSIGHFGKIIRRRYRLGEKTAHMNPGSGDAEVWPIEQQQGLFAVLGDVESLIGVRLTPESLMIPNKSVSGICFPTEINFRSCRLCRRENCPDRKAHFDKKLWDSVHD